jgi:phosphatidylserine decarboxylase
MLQLFNHLITTAPSWNDKGDRMGMVGLPINAVLDWPMGTPSGFALFLDPEVNVMLKRILNVWGEFLMSPASAYVLDNNSAAWFGEVGTKELATTASLGKGDKKFDELFQCDASKPHHGFKSWDDFFTRLFRPGIRPIASPEDDNVIVNACESKTYNVSHNVHARDQFWVKGQPYSVIDMLGHDPLADQFVGGTIYQAFLSALSYHRWHAPVSGKIVKAFVKDGTYYSEPLFEGLGDPSGQKHGIDFHGETTSQGYITAVATRGIIFIEANNPAIGLMAFIGVGMSEVSTCDITVTEGQKVKKGDQIGMFHFGGSSHCLLFRKGVEVGGFPKAGAEHNVPVLSKLAEVGK